MGKKLPYTPNNKIRAAARRLFLRSRERAATLKRDGYTCQECHRKQSKAKGREFSVECHHKEGILNWHEIYDAIRKNLLCDPEHMETLCSACHERKTPPASEAERGSR